MAQGRLQDVLRLVAAVILLGLGLAVLGPEGIAASVRAAETGTCPPVAGTPLFTIAFGTLQINGADAPVDTIIEAVSPRGDRVGCFAVTTAGHYGAMYVYGEDTSASPAIPGMRAGEQVSFRIDGTAAACTPALLWQNDRASHQANLSATIVAPPAAPSNLSAVAASHTQVNLSWQDNSADETGFRIERSPDGSTGWSEIASVGANVTGYNNTGLTCGTPYYYRVRAYRQGDGQFSDYSSTANATTTACPPPAPSNLSAVAASQTQINLTWQDNSSDEFSFRIERSPDGITGWTEIASVVADVTGYNNTGLICATPYHYRIRAYRQGDGQFSAYSNTANATTMACPPAAPSNLSAVAASQTQVNLSWQDNSSDESAFRVERSPDGTTGWTEIASVGANVTGYNNIGLSCGTPYHYRVRAYRQGDGQFSAYSNTATATTMACPPAAPSNLSAVAASQTQINLTWQDNSSDESSFRIERSPDGDTGWTEIASVAANVIGYNNIGLSCGTPYHYRVRAFRQADGQFSACSETANTTTASCGLTTDLVVKSSSDDAHEVKSTGAVTLGATSLNMTSLNTQIVGLRFQLVPLPPGAIITGAYLEFTAFAADTTATNLTFQGQAHDNAPTFGTATKNISNRTKTSASVPWSSVPAWTANATYRSPDLAPILQQIVNRPAWLQNNALVLIVTGTGQRRAFSFNGGATKAPLLHISYVVPCYTLTTSVAPPGTGSVVATPAPNCNADQYTAGTQVQLTATPAPGYSLSEWSGDLSGTTNPATLTMNGNKAVTATFVEGTNLRVAASADDASETKSTGAVLLTATSLNMTTSNTQIVGLRFQKIPLPPGAVITSAYLEFTAFAADTTATNLTFQGQAHDNAPTFGTATKNISNRTKTSASVTWSSVPAWTTNATYRSPDLAPILQQIVNRPAWLQNNALVLIVTGTGQRRAFSFNGGATKAPLLYISYVVPCYTLTTSVAPPGTGSVVTTPAPNCDADQYTAGTQVQITATPAPGYSLSEWSGDLSGTTNPATLTMNGNKAVTATFVEGVTIRVAASADDASETKSTGAVLLTATSLNMTTSNTQIVGLRFLKIPLPPGAVITGAYLEFTAFAADTTATNLTFQGQAHDNAPTFGTATKNISNRTKTSASVTWSSVPAWTTNATYRSPDLAPILQQIVNRPAWLQNNALVLIVTGTGQRRAFSFNGGATKAPLLHISYVVPCYTLTTGVAPPGTGSVVATPAPNCGADQYTAGTQVQLTAQPAPGYSLSEWSGDLPGTTNPATLTMNGNKAVTATFVEGANLRVAASADDASETKSTGAVLLTATSLNMTTSNTQIVGLRFLKIPLPPGAVITGAYLEFTAFAADTTATNLTFQGQAHDNAPTFGTATKNISNRTKTSASVTWSSVPAWTTNITYRSPDLAPILQQIVNRPGWLQNNALVLIITGTGQRRAFSYNGGAAKAPLLYITWQP